MSTRKYFGTDGVRGRVGELPITPDFVMRLGYAAGRSLVASDSMRAHERPTVLIGKDTRISGYMLEAALEAGFAAAGVDVMLAGPVPTPAVAYLTRALRLQAGVVISASHNPFFDNGIKFFSASGTKLGDDIEAKIEVALEQPMGCVDSVRLGKARRVADVAGRYIEFCKSTFPTELDLRGLKIVVDCAHGAAYSIAPKVFHELGADVVAVGAEPDGLNINHEVGATRPENLRAAVLAASADLGVALDGDGDRVVMVDRNGEIYDGDRLLYIITRARSQVGRVDGVVGTLMSNLGLELALRARGIPLERAKVGDRYVLERLHQRGWRLGGENSGHIICLDRHTTGDGIVSALQVLAAMRTLGMGMQEICADLVMCPQVLINVKTHPGFAWQQDERIERASKDVERALGGRGRVLLRASGTEPVIRVMVEGEDEAEVARLAHELAAVVTSASGVACP